jgi:hypothetical protein
MNNSFSAEIIEEWQSFFALQGEWNRLLSQSRADIIFLTWEWISCWVSMNRPFIRPFVIAVRDRYGDLVGLAPFYRANYRLLEIIPYRVLRIMADQATGAECLDWIVRKDIEPSVCCVVASTLAEKSDQWECIWMPYVPDWTSASNRILDACLQIGFFCHKRPVDFGVINLPSNYEYYFQKLSPNMRRDIRRYVRKILSRDDVVISQCNSEDELTLYLDGLFDLHRLRWKIKNEEGSFKRKPNLEYFYRTFCPVAIRNRWLRIYGIESNRMLKAIQFGYVYKEVFYSIQEGFDPEFIAGTGILLRAKIIEECIKNKIAIYDFLAEMTEHKRRWNAEKRLGMDLFIGNDKLKNRLLFGLGVWPTGRYLRPTNTFYYRHSNQQSQSGEDW